MSTHDYLKSWGFSKNGKTYCTSNEDVAVYVKVKDDSIQEVELMSSGIVIPVPNLKCRAQLFNLLYSFNLTKKQS